MDDYFPGEWSYFISAIFSKHQSSQIESWLSEDGVSEDLELLYRGSRDGWKTSDFHAKCDNKGATITVIRSSDGFIFGGFADKSWTSANKYCDSDKSFLFSLKSPSNEVGTAKMRIKQNTYSNAICHGPSYGPTFGGGHDLYIASDANKNNTSITNFGHTYELPPGQTREFLVGSNNFKVSEIEVFQVI